ncbi:MAG: hypothetical protein QOH72_3670 [Solirubrobacteraceae bacterium]|jgi:hypothetical protein|nr:hypothetical protein [Solirubrobacteraceae bacterium]
MADEGKGAQQSAAPVPVGAKPAVERASPPGGKVTPGSPAALRRRLSAQLGAVGHKRLETLEGLAMLAAASGVIVVVSTTEGAAQDPWDSSSAKAWLFLLATGALLIAANRAIGVAVHHALDRFDPHSVHRRDVDGADVRLSLRAAAPRVGAVLLAAFAVAAFPVAHGVLILLYVYPLVTWMPLLAALGLVAAGAVVAMVLGHGVGASARAALTWRTPVFVLLWVLGMAVLPALQGRALYEATRYDEGAELPRTTQPRLLPKAAAQAYGNAADLRDAHLVVDPASSSLVFSAEHKPGPVPRGPSDGIALQPLDRIDGTLQRRPPGFRTAVSAVGPGSLTWRGYRRHPLTRILERVIVPLAGGRAIGVAPYTGFKGFPVRHPFWQGVYVLHQDGRLEDLTPKEAIARPELAASGHLFPETLARDLAEAYGYRDGVFDRLHGGRTVVSDPAADSSRDAGNPQPYLTRLGDGRIDWVTVAHPASDEDVVDAVFLTDAVTGRTAVWHAPRGTIVLSNRGATVLARHLDIQWFTGSGDGSVQIRRAVEPRPVFVRRRLHYLVSIVPENGLHTAQRVDRTVLVDALRHRIVRVFNHADPEADDALRAFFGIGTSRP